MKRLVVGVFIGFAVGQFLALLGQVARLPYGISRMGGDSFGKVLLFASLTAVFVAFGLGASDVARSNCPLDPSDGDVRALAVAMRSQLALLWLTALVTLVILVFMNFGSGLVSEGHSLLSWTDFTTLVIVCSSGALTTYFSIYLGVLEKVGRTALSHILKGSAPLLGLLCTVPALAINKSVLLAATAWAIGFVVPGVAAKFALRLPNGPVVVYPVLTWRVLSVVAAPAAGFIATAIDPFIVSARIGTGAVSDYAIANRLGVLVLLGPMAIRPILWNYLRQAPVRERPQRRILLACGLYALLALPGVLLLVFAGPDLAVALGASAGTLSFTIFGVFAASAVMLALGMVFPAVIIGTPWEARYLSVLLLGSMGNIALSFILVAPVGLVGAALAGLLTNLAMFGFWLVVAFREQSTLTS